MPSFKSVLLCGLVKPSTKTKASTESSSDNTSSPPPLTPRPSRSRRHKAWVYFRRHSGSQASSSKKSYSSDTSFDAPSLLRAAPLKDMASPTGTWSSYKTAQEITLRDEEERERERRAAEGEERERDRERETELRARRRIEGQRESREVEEWFKRLMAQW